MVSASGTEFLFFEISSKYGERIPPVGTGSGLTMADGVSKKPCDVIKHHTSEKGGHY